MSATRDGSDQVWGLISTLVAGPAVWGAVGYGLDAVADTRWFTPLGVVIGFVTSFYIVYARTTYTSDRQHETLQPGRSELPSRDAARPDPGDVR